MEVVGQLRVRVKYGSQEEKLVLVIIGGNGPSLFGRNWLNYLCTYDWIGEDRVGPNHSIGVSERSGKTTSAALHG